MLYFVYGIKPDKMMELVKTSPHNVNPFKPNFIIKAIKWPGKGEEFSALFYGDENGKINTNLGAGRIHLFEINTPNIENSGLEVLKQKQ